MHKRIWRILSEPRFITGATITAYLIVLVLAIAVGDSQFVYTLLKPTGIFDWIQRPPDKAAPDVLY